MDSINEDALNMRLEDETFLNSKPNFKRNLVGLHNRGIYTIKDFISMDLKEIPNRENRHTFSIMIDILKCKYLGKDLKCDVLFDRKYPVTYQEYLKLKNQDHFPKIEDYLTLNKDLPYTEEDFFVRHMLTVFSSDCKRLGIPFFRSRLSSLLLNPDYRMKFLNGGESLSMVDYLKDEHIKNSASKYIVDFYLEYIKAKENKKDGPITSSELETLKNQLTTLTKERDELDKQIENIKNQIELMSEGKNNARK